MGHPAQRDYSALVRAVLCDGRWHKRQELILALIERVAPERLVRRSKGNGQNIEQRLRSGASEIVTHATFRLEREGEIERRGERNAREYRLRREEDRVLAVAVARALKASP